MSIKFVPVQWNHNKIVYDLVLALAVGLYLLIFLEVAPMLADATRPVERPILEMRAYGSCAFLMLTLILMIGPLARLDRRFLPLLYNRRHFGVLTCVIALLHADAVLSWYFVFSPIPKYEALLISNTAYDRVLGFPFEAFGMFALAVLAIMAATSHDFWLKFLGPPLWKTLHLMIYPAYAALVAHVGLGYLQDAGNPAFALVAGGGAMAVAGLHLAACWRGDPLVRTRADDDWRPVAEIGRFRDGRAVIVALGGDERAAVFRVGATLSALSNACAHQNGPLGEGRIIDGCVTCPWHGFQYRPEDGCAPAPFTEKLATYRLRRVGDAIEIDARANPPGTRVEPLTIGEWQS